MRNKTNGPKLTLKGSCFDCKHMRSTRYAVQGDSGFDVSCSHPNVGSRDIADSSWETPEWCPEQSNAIRAFAEHRAFQKAIDLALTDAGLTEGEKFALCRMQENASPEQAAALAAVLQHLWRFTTVRQAITLEFVP